jgi:hypothetical protein
MDIIKTWPSFFTQRQVRAIFFGNVPNWGRFYFTLGRGKPQKEIERLWFTHKGRIFGSVEIERIVQNDGSLPKLKRLDGEPSEWQIRADAWVAVCRPPMKRLKGRVCHEGFRGWRYFSIVEHRKKLDSKVRI